MNDDHDEFEDESGAARSARLRAQVASWIVSLGMAVLFIASTWWAEARLAEGAGNGLLWAGLPVAVLTLWWLSYLRLIRRFDELERRIEVRSVAISGALVLWIITSWGILAELLGVAMMPAYLFAPLAVLIYALVRFLGARFL